MSQIGDGVSELVNFGEGFTVMANVSLVPAQPNATGVTTILALICISNVSCAMNGKILPVPVSVNPMDMLLFVQLNAVPGTAPLKLIAEI